jgi:hypothetical protein
MKRHDAKLFPFISSMTSQRWLKHIVKLGLLLMMGAGMNANSSTMRWKEEVVLHNGEKLIVSRTQRDDPLGFREIGQPALRVEEAISFTIPRTNKNVIWKSDFGKGREDNLSLLLLDILDDIPYIAASPRFCHAYNKWGRPNPPYVFFKFDGTNWQWISVNEFPSELKETNVMIGGYNENQLSLPERAAPVLSAETVKRRNSSGLPSHFRTIVREPITLGVGSGAGCEELIFYKCGWISPHGTFGRDLMDRTCN